MILVTPPSYIEFITSFSEFVCLFISSPLFAVICNCPNVSELAKPDMMLFLMTPSNISLPVDLI